LFFKNLFFNIRLFKEICAVICFFIFLFVGVYIGLIELYIFFSSWYQPLVLDMLDVRVYFFFSFAFYEFISILWPGLQVGKINPRWLKVIFCLQVVFLIKFIFSISSFNTRLVENWASHAFFVFYMRLFWSHELDCEFGE